MVDEGIPASDKEAALERLLASLPPRDYFLNVGDVNNIAATLQTAWKRHPDQQKIVELYVQHMGADVLLHQRQAPLPGTPNAAHFAAVAASRPPRPAPPRPGSQPPETGPQPSVAPWAGPADSLNVELSSAAEAEVIEKRRAAETAAHHASAVSPGGVAQPVAATAAENAPCVHPLASTAAGNPASRIPPAPSSQRATRERGPPISHRDYAS